MRITPLVLAAATGAGLVPMQRQHVLSVCSRMTRVVGPNDARIVDAPPQVKT